MERIGLSGNFDSIDSLSVSQSQCLNFPHSYLIRHSLFNPVTVSVCVSTGVCLEVVVFKDLFSKLRVGEFCAAAVKHSPGD